MQEGILSGRLIFVTRFDTPLLFLCNIQYFVLWIVLVITIIMMIDITVTDSNKEWCNDFLI